MARWTLKKIEKETEPQCWHCSTHIKYVCWIENEETSEVIAVGRQCCSNYLLRSSIKKVNDTIKSMTRNAKIKAKVDNYIESHPEVVNSKQSMIKIANWIPVLGATWQWIKETYPDYYYAKYPNERK